MSDTEKGPTDAREVVTPAPSEEEKRTAEEEKRKQAYEKLRQARAAALMVLPAALLLGMLVYFVSRTLRVTNCPALILGALVSVACMWLAYVHERRYGKPKDRTFDAATPELDKQAPVIEVWKQVVDVQMHFNDMLMRTRNYALTLVLAILGGAGIALEKGAFITIGTRYPGPISLASVLLLVGVVGLFAFYWLDRFYYHTLLVASVSKGTEIENWLLSRNPAIDLTGTISRYSRVVLTGDLLGGRVAPLRMYARIKLTLFYLGIAVLLSLVAFIVQDVGTKKAEPASRSVANVCGRIIGGDTIALWVASVCDSSTRVVNVPPSEPSGNPVADTATRDTTRRSRAATDTQGALPAANQRQPTTSPRPPANRNRDSSSANDSSST